MRCSKCGAELLPGDTFCGNCGNKIIISGQTDTAHGTGQPFRVRLEPEEKMPVQNISLNTPANDDRIGREGYTNALSTNKSKGQKRSPIIAALIILMALLVVFTVFNFLLMTERIDTDKYDMLEGYKQSLSEFLNISDSTGDEKKEESNPQNKTLTEEVASTIKTETTTTQQSTISVVTTTSAVTEATIDSTQGGIPAELQQYKANLSEEGKTYRITLQEDDWYINYRSSPKLIDINTTPNNILGKLKHGSQIYVEYIYNGTWAVFYKDGRYVFSSLYASNDPSKNRLMEVM